VFGRTLTLFRLFGFSVRVDLSWVFIAVLVTWSLAHGLFPTQFPGHSPAVYWTLGVLGAAGLFGSIVFHELCHSLVARRFGIEMRGITLFIFGGVAEMGREPPSPRSEFLMAAAGPLSSLFLALVLSVARFVASPVVPEPVDGLLWYLQLINVTLALFNVLPAFPLDGGRMLRAFLWARRGNIRWATRITSGIGSGFGMVMIALGVLTFLKGNFITGVWWFLIGLFLRGAANAAYQQLVLRRALEGEPVRTFMTPDPVTVDPSLYVRDLVEQYLYRTHHKLYPVVDEGALLGCVTLGQVKGVPREKWDWVRVQDITQPCAEENSIQPGADAMEAMTRMRRFGVSRRMVVEDGRLVGVITLKDLMGFLSMKVELESR
jgi:Zn-dependent protease/predicted transcriptional regulator